MISVLLLFLKCFLVGVIVSAPMGPVGVLCVQRTLNKGRWYGFVTGCGAALSDLIYAAATGYGMKWVDPLIHTHRLWLQVFGSLLLFGFGLYMFLSNPIKSVRQPSKQRDGYWHNGVTAFLVTFSNPMILLLFIALFARFDVTLHVLPDFQKMIAYAMIITGALLWWFVLTTGVNMVRERFNLRGIFLINRTMGAVVMIAAVIGVLFTLFA
ncbi:MAG TPA: LysE family transporter [Bacteroidaceae bacterium]|nr:LysE family transporter [Bacteroidaceae bacterium]